MDGHARVLVEQNPRTGIGLLPLDLLLLAASLQADRALALRLAS